MKNWNKKQLGKLLRSWAGIGVGFLLFLSTSCTGTEEETIKRVEYKGPSTEAVNVVTIYSDSAQIKLKLSAPLEQNMQNGDILYPKGIFITFYENGVPSSIIKAKYGKFDKAKNLYFGRNDVIVKNIIKNEQLNTEELFWDKVTRTIHTEKFVRITTPDEIVTGEGLTAKDDFSDYTINKFIGSITLKNEP